jgi:uncharacterized protein involved in exopolysaccharide biosynthesis
MVQRKTMNDGFDSTNILLFLYKWRKPLFWVMIIAMIGSVIISLTLTEKYKSTVIMYPAATSNISQALLVQNRPATQKSILDFGVDEETEQMLQILNSNRIRDRIIEQFNLEEHYDIDPETKYRLTKLHRYYENNISFKRTEYMAVKISVLDTDPQYAADIANNIADLLDSTKNEIQKVRARRAYEIVRDQYYNLLGEIQQMEDSLTTLRQLGVHDYESQVEMINRQFAIEMAGNNTRGIQRLQDKLDVLAKYGGPYVSLRDRLEFEQEKLSLLKSKYEEIRTDAEEVLPTKFIVNSAFPAERKSYPIRWLIVLVSTVSAFLFTLVIILIIENVREYLPFLFNTGAEKSADLTGVRSSKAEGNTEKRPPPAFSSSSSHSAPEKPSEKKKIISEQPENDLIQNEEETSIVNASEKDNTERNNTEILTNQTYKKGNQMDRFFANTNLLKLLFKWRIHLAVILLIGLILAVIISSPVFMEPKFKSYAVVYPANLDSYSDESESEQMLQFLQSKDIRDRIIKKYDLPARYEIDSSYKYFQSAMNYEYSKNFSISKTPYESVRIEVLDTDPIVAAQMVEDVINFYNDKVLQTQRGKFKEVVEFVEQRLIEKQAEIDSVKKMHAELRIDHGLIDYPNQSREVARGFLGTVDGNNTAQNINTKEVLKLKKELEEKGGDWIFYNDRLFQLVEEYAKIKVDLDEAQMNYNRDVTFSNIVSAPYPADKKSYPVRWIIVVVTLIGVLFFSLVVMLIIENFDSIKRNI